LQNVKPSGVLGNWYISTCEKRCKSQRDITRYTALEFFWWIHFVAIFVFLFIIPRSKHLHLVFAAFNTYWHSLEHQGALLPMNLDEESGQVYGVSKLKEFTWKQFRSKRNQ